jgi:hypothetical protein
VVAEEVKDGWSRYRCLGKAGLTAERSRASRGVKDLILTMGKDE